MVKLLALVSLGLAALGLSGCQLDPPSCVILTCDAGSDCPNGDCRSGVCYYPNSNVGCTSGGGTTTGGGSTAGGTTAGSSGTGGTGGGGITGGLTGGGTTAGSTTGKPGTSGGTTGGCQAAICGPCTLVAGCCDNAGTHIVCDPSYLLCAPPGYSSAAICHGGGTTGGMTGGITTGGTGGMTDAGLSCTPLPIGDGGYCSPNGNSCFCGADYDCCSGGCCDLTNWPGVCKSSGIGPGLSPGPSGPQPNGGACIAPLTCQPFGGDCSVTGCCGSGVSAKCQSNACCQDTAGSCLTNADCCSGKCSSQTFLCGT